MSITIIGTGLFGTALALNLSSSGKSVTLWSSRENVRQSFKSNQMTLFDNIKLTKIPNTLNMTESLKTALVTTSVLIMCKSSQETSPFLEQNSLLLKNLPIVFCAKGIDSKNLLLQTEIDDKIRPGQVNAVLTGPSFAKDIAQEKPTALTLACNDLKKGAILQSKISSPSLRLYLSSDKVGAQLGGALKNIIAIGCGMVHGKGLGESARTALMTRGFSEIKRLGVSMGANQETFSGLSGLGDLSLTCNSINSRNFNYGIEFSTNSTTTNRTVEGYTTINSSILLMKKYKVDAPVIHSISKILNGHISIEKAIKDLMKRPLKLE